MTTAQLLGSTAVLKGTGVTYRQLDYWARVNAVQPAHATYGSGDHRAWTERDRLRLKAIGNVLRDLSDLRGFSTSGSTDLVRRIWNDLEEASATTIRQGCLTVVVTLDEQVAP